VLGTTDYVSPEQALGHAVTGQSDLYSLGIVLFEMLAGTVPFTGDNQVSVAMKHVRDELPDVQVRRPEVSSALGAVVDRATAKDLGRRYSSDAELIADLEDVLSIEAARSGQATGEATAVIRTLPGRAKRRIPLKMRHPVRLTIAIAMIAAATAAALILLADRTHHGTGVGNVTAPARQHQVRLAQDAAHDYDPFGDTKKEHPDEARFVVDRDPNTTWSTESYRSFNKPGVGIYVDAKPGVAARSILIQSKTTGWAGEVYGAKVGPPATLPDIGWQKLGTIPGASSKHRLPLPTGTNSFRYYLVWITSLPPGEQKVEISEIYLFA
jgi:eukaryotic-like serine/threonine-protein kinase